MYDSTDGNCRAGRSRALDPAGGGPRRRAARGADAALRRGGGRAGAAPLAGGALLLRGGPDRLRSLSSPGRARDRLRRWWRRGWCRSGRAIGSRPTAATRASSRGCSPAGCSSRSTCPRRELEAARDLVRAREDARLDRMRDRHRLSKFCLRHGRPLPTQLLDGRAAQVAVRAALRVRRRSSITFDTYLHAVDLVDARIEQLERAIRETAEQEPWRELVAQAALPARHRHADRARARRPRSATSAASSDGRGVHGLRRARALASTPPASSAGRARSPRSATATSAGCWSRRPGTRARRPTVGYELARRQRGQDAARDRARLALPAAPLPALAADGRPRQATPEDRRRLRARARRLRLGDRDRATTPHRADRPASRPRAADASDHTENPRSLYAAPARR